MGWKIIFAPQALEELEQIAASLRKTMLVRRFGSATIWQIARNQTDRI